MLLGHLACPAEPTICRWTELASIIQTKSAWTMPVCRVARKLLLLVPVKVPKEVGQKWAAADQWTIKTCG